jgi:hypothetical protein
MPCNSICEQERGELGIFHPSRSHHEAQGSVNNDSIDCIEPLDASFPNPRCTKSSEATRYYELPARADYDIPSKSMAYPATPAFSCCGLLTIVHRWRSRRQSAADLRKHQNEVYTEHQRIRRIEEQRRAEQRAQQPPAYDDVLRSSGESVTGMGMQRRPMMTPHSTYSQQSSRSGSSG